MSNFFCLKLCQKRGILTSNIWWQSVDWHSFDWAEILRRLTVFAFRRRQLRGAHSSLADAEDLAAEAVKRLLDSDYAEWDPKLVPDVLQQLGSIVNGLLSNELRTGRVKKERASYDRSAFDSAQQANGTEDAVAEGEECRQALSLLDKRIENDEMVQRLLPLEMEGISKPANQARYLSVSIEMIYKARRRLAAHREAIRLELKSPSPARKPRGKRQNPTSPSV